MIITNVEAKPDNKGFIIEVHGGQCPSKIEFVLETLSFDNEFCYGNNKKTSFFLRSVKKVNNDFKDLRNAINGIYKDKQSNHFKTLGKCFESVFKGDTPDITLDQNGYLCLGYVKFGLPSTIDIQCNDVKPNPRILILGTFPGDNSLQMRHYYSSRKNYFWEVMKDLRKVDEKDFNEWKKSKNDASLEKMETSLVSKGIVLWDIFKIVDRNGSLDNSITKGLCNDIKSFLDEYPNIECIVINGKMSGNKPHEKFIKSYFSKLGLTPDSKPRLLYLNSTSKSNGKTSEKIAKAWKIEKGSPWA